jgi:prepilin-type N-terminal cleavage/methylation domain-containing protein
MGNKKGMTLIEVIVSFAILAVIALAVVSVLMSSAKAKMEGDSFTFADEQLSKAIAEGANAATAAKNELSVVVNTASGPKTIVIPGVAYEYSDDETGKSFRLVDKPAGG